MILGYDHVLDRNDYTFGCPEGTWIGRLDEKAWGKLRNLLLYFTDQSTNGRYWLSVFDRDNYRARDDGRARRCWPSPSATMRRAS
jgi:hypothetical protein